MDTSESLQYTNYMSRIEAATITQQCNSLFYKHIQMFSSGMTGRACMGEVLTQVWNG